MPLGITHVWISNCIAQKKQGVSCQYYSGDSLSHPVKQTRSREVSYVSYHIQTPVNTIRMAETIKTILAPSFPPSRDRKSTRLNSSHVRISYAVFCLKKKTT